MRKSKTIRIFALIVITILLFFLVVPPFTRRWSGNLVKENASAIPANEWKKFSSTERKFYAWFPGKPELTNVIVSIPGVDVSMPCFFVWNRQTEYAVNCIDFPENITKNLKKFKPAKEFDLYQSGIATDLPAKIVYQKDLEFEGYPARDIEYVVGGNLNYTGITRLIRVNDQLYQLVFIFRPPNSHPTDRDAFLNSFRIQK